MLDAGFSVDGWASLRMVQRLRFFGDEIWASQMAQMIKNPPVMQETWVPSLGQKDLAEKGMATHSSVLAWRIQWTEEPAVHWVANSQTRLSD